MWSVFRRGTALVLLGIGLAACSERKSPSFITGVRAAQGATMYLRGPHARRAPDEPFFLDQRAVSVTGFRRPDGTCSFRHAVTLARGDTVTERVLEFDPDNCLFVISQGRLLFSPAFGSGHVSRTLSDSVGGGVLRSSGRGEAHATDVVCNPGLQSVSYADQALWNTDPVAISVNESELFSTWWWDDSCIQQEKANLTTTWRYATGWQLDTAYIQTTWTDPFGHTMLSVNGVALLQNGLFCNLVPGYVGTIVYTYYNPNEIDEDKDGNATFVWNGPSFGGCSFLLTAHRQAILNGQIVPPTQ